MSRTAKQLTCADKYGIITARASVLLVQRWKMMRLMLWKLCSGDMPARVQISSPRIRQETYRGFFWGRYITLSLTINKPSWFLFFLWPVITEWPTCVTPFWRFVKWLTPPYACAGSCTVTQTTRVLVSLCIPFHQRELSLKRYRIRLNIATSCSHKLILFLSRGLAVRTCYAPEFVHHTRRRPNAVYQVLPAGKKHEQQILTNGIGSSKTATNAKSVFAHLYVRAANICSVNKGNAIPMRLPTCQKDINQSEP